MQTFDLKNVGIYCDPKGRGDVVNICFCQSQHFSDVRLTIRRSTSEVLLCCCMSEVYD